MNGVDRIIFGGKILTMDPRRPVAEAVAISGERIAFVGSLAEGNRFRDADTELVDLAGGTALPGFVEAHGHPLYSALAWGDPVVDIRAVHAPTYAAVIEKIRRRIAKAKSGEFVWCTGLDLALLPDLHEPTKDVLNALAPDNPLVVQAFNFHAVYINSAAAAICGLCQTSVAPPGGQILHDARGEPWKLQDNAIVTLQAKFDELCGQGRALRELDVWLWKFAHAGYTTSAEIGLRFGWEQHFRAYLRDKASPIRIRAYERAAPNTPSRASLEQEDDIFQVIGMKVLGDGSFFVGNVWLSRPYLNSEMTIQRMGMPESNFGQMNWRKQELVDLIGFHAARGWQIATHAQGDRTIDIVLDCYEEILAKHPQARRPFRIEHCGLMREDQIDRAVRLGVVCSFFNAMAFHWGEALVDDMFGAERGEQCVPFGSAVRRGMRVSYHCDSPMTWPDALLCVQFGVTRQTSRGRLIGASQRVDIDTALRAVTIDAAHHLLMDDKIGSIEPGKYADLAILETDPRACDPSTIAQIPILGTYLSGRAVWGVGRAERATPPS